MENYEKVESTTRTCPACGKKIPKEEMHRARTFEVIPVAQFAWARFWVCDNTIDSLEALVKHTEKLIGTSS